MLKTNQKRNRGNKSHTTKKGSTPHHRRQTRNKKQQKRITTNEQTRTNAHRTPAACTNLKPKNSKYKENTGFTMRSCFVPRHAEQEDLLKPLELVKEKGKLPKAPPGALCDDILMFRSLASYNQGKKILTLAAQTASKKRKREQTMTTFLAVVAAMTELQNHVEDDAWISKTNEVATEMHDTPIRFIHRTTENAATLTAKELGDKEYKANLDTIATYFVFVATKVPRSS